MDLDCKKWDCYYCEFQANRGEYNPQDAGYCNHYNKPTELDTDWYPNTISRLPECLKENTSIWDDEEPKEESLGLKMIWDTLNIATGKIGREAI